MLYLPSRSEGVVETLGVLAPRNVAFGLGSGGDLLGGAVVNRGYKHISAPYEGYAVAVGAGGGFGGTGHAEFVGQGVASSTTSTVSLRGAAPGAMV